MAEYIRICFEFADGLTSEKCERFLRVIRKSEGTFEGENGIETAVYDAEEESLTTELVDIKDAANKLASEHEVNITSHFKHYDVLIRQFPQHDSSGSTALTITESYYPFEESNGSETWKDRTQSFLDLVGDLADAAVPTLGYGARGNYPLEYDISADELEAGRLDILSNVNLWGPRAAAQLDLSWLRKHCFYVRELDSGHVLFVVRPLTDGVNDAYEPEQTLVDALDLEFASWS